jgi:Cu/Ag efflux protein CusF
MTDVAGRWRVATLAGALALTGGVSGVMAQRSPPSSDERGRVGPEELIRGRRQAKEPTVVPPVAAEVKMLAATGTVVSVDRDARTVTLSDDEGSTLTVQVPPDDANFDQLKEGDRINVNIRQPLELESTPR